MKAADDELRLDGNAAAGLLAELWEMGAVLRCPLCSGLMMVVTRLDGATRIDLRGVRVLRVIRPGMAVAFQTGE
jgi:hypothetical protein